jgi:tetratricopeptide (TPR) repeat protein
LLVAFVAACAQTKPVVRDQLVVEKLRLRITKVRNAIAETRGVIAASRGAPYLPEIYMRLAELLSEEARYHYMVAYEREQRRSKSLHVPQVRFLKEQAIGTYEMILKRYPDTHLADRILFNISHEQRELGEFDDMKKTLKRLVKDYPDSPYRTEALLVLGDFHFDRMEFARAQGYYNDIVQQKDDPLLGLAYYKLGWVYVNVGDCKQALYAFERAIKVERLTEEDEEKEAAKGKKKKKKKPKGIEKQEFEIPPDEESKREFAGHKSVNVEREALVDLTYCYSQERKPEKAVAYLRDLASTREAYVAALGKMANRYALIEQPRGAADVARELLRLAPDDEERLDDARMLHSVVVRMKDYTEVGADVYLILRAMRRQLLKPDLEESAAALVEKEFELIARDLATKSHEQVMEAVREAGDKPVADWTKKRVTPDATAEAYEIYLDVLPDSPHRLDVVSNLADVLMEGGHFLEAGHRYREVATLLDEKIGNIGKVKEEDKDEKKGKSDPAATKAALQAERADALYNAVVAYQSSLEAERARGHLERAAARAGLRRAGGLYLAKGAPELEKARKIKFAIGQSYYDEGSYLEAIDLLTAVAYEYPGSQQGDAAVHMVLDSYRTINDLSGLINIGRRFLAADSPISAEIKGQVKPIVAAAEQNRLDELSLAASGEHAGGMEVLLAFADRYKDSDLGERAMLSAFVAARASGDVGRLYALGEEVIARFPQSNQIPGVVSTMGRTAAVRFEFERAISYLERAAELSEDQRATLLLAAGELREQLADKKGALADYRKALAAAGEGAMRGEAAAHLADLIERGGTAKEIVDALTPLADPPHPEISSRLGLALLRLGRTDEAEEHLRQVVEGSAAASAAAQARANYGMAEIMLRMLEDFDPPPELDAIEEAVGLVDVVIQSYLAAARLADPVYSQAALARLARAAEIGAEKIEQLKLPSELSAEERAMVEEAMARRAEGLRSGSTEALTECARRAESTYLLDEAGRACIAGVPPKEDPVRFHALKPRGKAADKTSGIEGARERLSRNPDDLEALTEVGRAYLDAGDAHGARLVLARTVEAGGGAAELNLLGIASYKAGDVIGALDAFGRAKDAGSHAAALNLAAVCMEIGLDGMAKEVLAETPSGKPSGRLLDSARSLRGGAK